ncbi:MAG: hypothetical protein ABUL72_04905, partial [Armatimonadota bacterium]
PASVDDIVTAMNALQSQNIIAETWEEAGIARPQILTDEEIDKLPTVRAEQKNQSNAVLLTATGPREADVLSFLRELPNVYSREVRKQADEANKTAMTVLQSRMKDEGATLDALQKQAGALKAKQNMVDSTVQAEMTFKKISDLESQASTNKAAYEGAVAARVQGEAEFAKIPDTVKHPFTETNAAEVQREGQLLNQLKSQRAALVQRLLPTHPEVKALDAQISQQEAVAANVAKTITIEREEPNPTKEEYRKLVTDLKTRETSAKAAYQGSQALLAQAQAQLPATTAGTNELQQLEQQIKEKQALLGRLKDKEQVLVLRGNYMRTPLRVLSPASPTKQVKPIVPVYVGLGALVGLILGCFFAVSRDNLSDKVANIEAAEYLTGGHLLATIPRRKRSGNAAIDAHLKAVSFESYRLLRTNLMLQLGDAKPKQVMLTSMLPGEGVSVVSANLATACAAAGLRTIFVDANFRRPSGSSLFGVPQSARGLGEALATNEPAQSFLSDSGTEGLKVMSVGAVPSNIGEALASPRMKQIIDELGQIADIVVYDTAAYQGIADPVAMAPLIGKVIL